MGAGGPAQPSLSPVASILPRLRLLLGKRQGIRRLYFLGAFPGVAQLVFIGFLHVSIPGSAFCALFLRGALYVQCSIWVMQLVLTHGRRKVSFLNPPRPSFSTYRTCLRLSLSPIIIRHPRQAAETGQECSYLKQHPRQPGHRGSREAPLSPEQQGRRVTCNTQAQGVKHSCLVHSSQMALSQNGLSVAILQAGMPCQAIKRTLGTTTQECFQRLLWPTRKS